ncbi:hypothetical protein C8F01DRAFT_1165324 [Mycena amicta]|nr:hypothetical protein C8F01DRAFT_1165324 [Mycena amicta]
MLDEAPHPRGARYVSVVLHIAATKDDESSSADEKDSMGESSGDEKDSCVVSVAQAWLDHLMLPMLTMSIDDPASSQTSTLDETVTVIESADRTEQQQFRDALAEREEHYCAITGYFDRKRAHWLGANGKLVPRVPTHKMAAAHVIPLYLNHFHDARARQIGVRLLDAATTWDMFRSWTQIDLHGLIGSKISSPENGIFMTSDDHDFFRSFKFYFDKEAFPENANKYEVRCLRHHQLSSAQTSAIVTFRDKTPPNPEFVRIHAAFAKVLNLSGAAAYMEDLERDAERMERLHLDGLADFGQALNSKLLLLSGGADLS